MNNLKTGDLVHPRLMSSIKGRILEIRGRYATVNIITGPEKGRKVRFSLASLVPCDGCLEGHR